MNETFAQYLERWLKQSTQRGLTNPLVKMPIKRFRLLQAAEFMQISAGGVLILGTLSDPIARNLYRNFQTHLRERGERCAYISCGAVEMVVAGGVDQQPRTSLFPIYLKRASLETAGDKVRVTVSDDEPWQINPTLQANLRPVGIKVPSDVGGTPEQSVAWVKAQLGNRASVRTDSYVGLFSSQQMVLQERLTEPSVRRALARNPVIQAKIAGNKVAGIESGEITDNGLEELGLILPCDDHQLRVIQLSNQGYSLQVEGPPGTGKSQTIANIISNAIFKGQKVLFICDKRAAINQVEESLTDCGIRAAILNLHDEDLDKRDFLKQASDKLPTNSSSSARPRPSSYPLDQLRESREALNDRVIIGRSIAHPSLQISERQALGGLIQLRKELKDVPNIAIDSWQSLSKERLGRLLRSIAEWPGLATVLSNSTNVWNTVRPDAFDANPNAVRELVRLIESMQERLESLEELREMAAAVGVDYPIQSHHEVNEVLEIVATVLDKPACYSRIVGNSQFTLEELDRLQSSWDRSRELIGARHPVTLGGATRPDADQRAQQLLSAENATTWQELSQRLLGHQDSLNKIKDFQTKYLGLCGQLGLVYSPLTNVRRAQLLAILGLGRLATAIPRSWWGASVQPVLMIEGWTGRLKACIGHQNVAPFPLHFLALERIAATHWKHVDAMAEHGFNLISYFRRYVDDRKSKLALQQSYPSIPLRGFKEWRELTLHAVAARGMVAALRSSSETHAILAHLTENYLSIAHEAENDTDQLIEHEDVKRLRQTAATVQQWRDRNDLFEVSNVDWQTLWESPNPKTIQQVEAALAELESLKLPDGRSDNLELALDRLGKAIDLIQGFLRDHETKDGNRLIPVLESISAQKEFSICQKGLSELPRYAALLDSGRPEPDWKELRKALLWRERFHTLRADQRFDMDSLLWGKLRDRLEGHWVALNSAGKALQGFFEGYRESMNGSTSSVVPFSELDDYRRLKEALQAIPVEIQQHRHPLWLEKRKWQKKLSAFPELRELWSKLVAGEVIPDNAEKLFCFNLLRLCEPIAEPYGAELKQTIRSFADQDEQLASWVLAHLKARLRKTMEDAATRYAQSESEIRRLSGLQRVRGTIRELVKAHFDYLLAAKSCWMMSPTSLANLLCGEQGSVDVLATHEVLFDLVIFDESSQIRVLDGLLSMAFGRQTIIVGDKHQLPPTDFFSSFADADAETDASDFGTSESLLNEFEGVFEEDKTHVMLLSHYRSETPDLIRFSNDWFYSRAEPGTLGTGRLEMYPPAHVAGIGRRLHYVSSAVYSETAGRRNNPTEAREVVKLIELHVREHADKSLGVVTMNIPQMELIDELLQAAPASVRTYCADERKFFLRNLETVQGDQMDRIIISLTYGKNPAGQFSASVLGPLTKSGGERRLNVAITRSRNGMTVVSSLKAADLAASGAQSNGFKCLKAFLTDLESAQLTRTYGIGAKRFERQNDGVSNVVHCESPFEEQVVEFLENEGFEIECQYGDGRFRLDVVVKEKGRNILAIECDGASYHSSLVARTRDRARDALLRERGWIVHRVWSTNWWFYEQQEKQGIVDAINAARQVRRN